MSNSKAENVIVLRESEAVKAALKASILGKVTSNDLHLLGEFVRKEFGGYAGIAKRLLALYNGSTSHRDKISILKMVISLEEAQTRDKTKNRGMLLRNATNQQLLEQMNALMDSPEAIKIMSERDSRPVIDLQELSIEDLD